MSRLPHLYKHEGRQNLTYPYRVLEHVLCHRVWNMWLAHEEIIRNWGLCPEFAPPSVLIYREMGVIRPEFPGANTYLG